jgi:hypothetical protein
MSKPIAAPLRTPHVPEGIEPPLSYVGVEEGQFEGCACEVCGVCPTEVRVWRWRLSDRGAAGPGSAVEEGHYYCALHRQAANAVFGDPAGRRSWIGSGDTAPEQKSVRFPMPPPVYRVDRGDGHGDARPLDVPLGELNPYGEARR